MGMQDLSSKESEVERIQTYNLREQLSSGMIFLHSMRHALRAAATLAIITHTASSQRRAARFGNKESFRMVQETHPLKTSRTVEVEVRMTFGQRVQGSEGKNATRTLELDVEGKDSVFEVKQRIAVSTGPAEHTAAQTLIAVTLCRSASWQAAFGNKVAPAQLLLYFGPNEAVLGQQYEGDPAVDEHSLLLSEYSCLAWLQKFPHWHLSVRFVPPTPLPPGVAAHRAAALSEGKDPDVAVRDARNKARLCITVRGNSASRDDNVVLALWPQQMVNSMT